MWISEGWLNVAEKNGVGGEQREIGIAIDKNDEYV